MATEKGVQEALRDAILTLSDFESGDVTINDWRVLDGSTQGAPYVVIETADEVNVDMLSSNFVYTSSWGVPVTLIERFIDWRASYDNLRDRREDVFGAIAANIGSGLFVESIRADSPVSEIYSTSQDPANTPDAVPVFVAQRVIVTIRET